MLNYKVYVFSSLVLLQNWPLSLGHLNSLFVSSEVEMNRTWTDNIILFQTLQLYTRLDIKHQIRFTKLD